MAVENRTCEVAADRDRIGAGAETHGVGEDPEQGERDRSRDQHEGERMTPARWSGWCASRSRAGEMPSPWC